MNESSLNPMPQIPSGVSRNDAFVQTKVPALLYDAVRDAHDEEFEQNLFNHPPPPLPDKAPNRPKDKRYKEQYGVIIICENEQEQNSIFKQIITKYQKVRLVNT